MRKSGDARPHKRDGIWYMVRRVPKEFAHLDRRNPVKISTELEIYWRGMSDGQTAEARLRYEAAQKRAPDWADL